MRSVNNTYENELILFNRLGNRATTLVGGNGDGFSEPFLVGNYDPISHFETEGIGAGCDFYPFGYITINQAGTRAFMRPYFGTGTGNELDASSFLGGQDYPNQFQRLSAITRFDDGVFAYVDKAGKRYMVADGSANPVKYFGPFKL